MERRAVLRSVSAATAAGLAGCPGNGEESPDPECRTPGENLNGALPRSEAFSDPAVDANNSAEEVGGATRHVFASYTTEEETFLFVIGEYSDEATANSVASDEELWDSFGDEVVGTLVVENYVYVGMGPNESGVRTLVAQSSALNEACVEENLDIL